MERQGVEPDQRFPTARKIPLHTHFAYRRHCRSKCRSFPTVRGFRVTCPMESSVYIPLCHPCNCFQRESPCAIVALLTSLHTSQVQQGFTYSLPDTAMPFSTATSVVMTDGLSYISFLIMLCFMPFGGLWAVGDSNPSATVFYACKLISLICLSPSILSLTLL